MTDEERQAQEQENLRKLQEFVDQQTAGLRTNRDEILGEKRGLQEQLDALKATWGDLDPERVKAVLSQLENDEDAKLIAEGKVDEVIERRTANMRTDYETKLTAAHDRIGELEGQLTGRVETIKRLKIDSEIREKGLAMKTPIQAKALNDAIRAGREIFTLNDEDEVVAMRDGAPVIGKDGRTPLGIEEWLGTTFEEGTTLWWGTSSGGGAHGGGDRTAEGLDREAVDNMSSREKLKVGLAADAA